MAFDPTVGTVGALAAAAPLLALTYVRFAPPFVFDDPVVLAGCQLALFALASVDLPCTRAGALAALVWLANGMALRIRGARRAALTQRREGERRVAPDPTARRLRVPLPA